MGTEQSNLRVHVAPIGFEIDRVVMPAVQRKADRVWLMIHDNPAADKALDFVDKVRAALQKRGIEVREHGHDRLDLFQIIRSVRAVIEDEAGNHVYVNLASGSKIQAIGCMMACMMFNSGRNVYPFYAEAREYRSDGKAISSGIKEIKDLPSYEIRVPDRALIGALRITLEAGGEITKKELAAKAEKEGVIKVNSKNAPQARFASLDKNVIQPLLEWGFVDVEKVGRTRHVRVTAEGRGAASFLVPGPAQGS